MVPLALLDFDTLPMAVAIIGAGLGYLLGSRLAPGVRDAPLVGLATLAALFYIVAYMLVLLAATIGAVVLLTIFFRDVWPALRQSWIEFSRESGIRFRRRQLGPRSEAHDLLSHRIDTLDQEMDQVRQQALEQHQQRLLIDWLEEIKEFLEKVRGSLF